MYQLDDNIAALATPWGKSAIAIIRLSGRDSLINLDKIFKGKKKPSATEGYTIIYGHIIDPATEEKIDEVLISIFKAPNSYTGENSAEINCHGNPVGIQRILNILYTNGFREAEPGEFTLRAFINRKMDLTRAEAVQEIVSAKTEQARELALHKLEGKLFSEIDSIKQEILSTIAQVELMLDYPEEDANININTDKLTDSIERIKNLLGTYKTGRILKEGIKIALAGNTNAGKSSLFNLMLKEDRAIVSDIHGTTRDYLESWLSIKGMPVLLYDTAGIRKSEDPIEAEGIKRSRLLMESSNLVIYIVDSTIGITDEDDDNISSIEKIKKIIKVWNKTDLSKKSPPAGFIPLSCKTGEGFKELEDAIIRSVSIAAVEDTHTIVIDSDRQKRCLEESMDALFHALDAISNGEPLDIVAVPLRAALNSLGELTGEINSEDILEQIFCNFCVGK
ncbi:tRNA uridine-5-carboxymethylaminomethyl(34) synthesis GTPase MnmE [Spirochaetia bacterium 38H-sp]|uniref:tRNA modification GTPase MnmE n=1 Tax=Rarispira pelagica TaxID=3141764 RepID=A0ABU9UC14_9SPIR